MRLQELKSGRGSVGISGLPSSPETSLLEARRSSSWGCDFDGDYHLHFSCQGSARK